MHQMFVASVRG